MEISEISKAFEYKTEAEWRKLPQPEFDGVEFLVAPAGNKKMRDRWNQKMKVYGRGFRDLPDETVGNITVDIAPGALVLDWRGFKDAGADVPFTETKAREMFKACPEMLAELLRISEAMSREKVAENSEEVDNLEK